MQVHKTLRKCLEANSICWKLYMIVRIEMFSGRLRRLEVCGVDRRTCDWKCVECVVEEV